MQALVEHLAKSLVDHPDQVKVVSIEDGERAVTIQLTVAPEDMGKVIGSSCERK